MIRIKPTPARRRSSKIFTIETFDLKRTKEISKVGLLDQTTNNFLTQGLPEAKVEVKKLKKLVTSTQDTYMQEKRNKIYEARKITYGKNPSGMS